MRSLASSGFNRIQLPYSFMGRTAASYGRRSAHSLRRFSVGFGLKPAARTQADFVKSSAFAVILTFPAVVIPPGVLPQSPLERRRWPV